MSKAGLVVRLLERDFGSVEAFKAHFNAKTAAIQGSGWGWLAYNTTTKKLEYHQTANQDRLVDLGAHLVPLLTVDIWEHAYYLDYQNKRDAYIDAFLDKIINWDFAAQNYEADRAAA